MANSPLILVVPRSCWWHPFKPQHREWPGSGGTPIAGRPAMMSSAASGFTHGMMSNKWVPLAAQERIWFVVWSASRQSGPKRCPNVSWLSRTAVSTRRPVRVAQDAPMETVKDRLSCINSRTKCSIRRPSCEESRWCVYLESCNGSEKADLKGLLSLRDPILEKTIWKLWCSWV